MRSSDINRILEDNGSITLLPLIDRGVGGITYQHSSAEHFYRDVFIGSAERNYYIDRHHELCLSAYYNRRVPGKYEFIPEYLFFVTKKRMCLDIHRNLGNISDESMILEKYVGIEATIGSSYYCDFCDLKEMIDKSIKYKRENIFGPFDIPCMMCGPRTSDDGIMYDFFEIPIKERQEVVQLYTDQVTHELKLLSVSKILISNMIGFFKDFDILDRDELHLRTFLPIEEYALAENSPYRVYYDDVMHWYEFMEEDIRWI